MVQHQLNLFVPVGLTDYGPLLNDLHERWPVIGVWGDLSGHTIQHVIEIYPGDTVRSFALLMQSSTGHRWHLCWHEGRFNASSAGWKDVDGRSYLSKRGKGKAA